MGQGFGALRARGVDVTLPKLSIAAKLYAIFALMATTTVVLSVVAVMSARTHAAMTQKFQSVSAIAVDVERASALVHAGGCGYPEWACAPWW